MCPPILSEHLGPGVRVRVRRDPDGGSEQWWPAEPLGTITSTGHPDEGPQGHVSTYFVEFDEPQHDNNGDGPFLSADVADTFLTVVRETHNTSTGLEIDKGRIKRFWAAGYHEVHFEIRANSKHLDLDRPALLELATAVRERLTGSDNDAKAEQWISTHLGWSGLLVDVRTFDDALVWFDHAADVLGRQRRATITGGPQSSGDGLGTLPPAPAAFLAYTTDTDLFVALDERVGSWGVSEERTHRIAEKALDWAITEGCRQFVTRATDWEIEAQGDDWGQALAQSASRYTGTRLSCSGPAPAQQRLVDFTPQGQAFYQVSDHRTSWNEKVKVVSEALIWSAPDLELGFIRTDRGNTTGWDSYLNPWAYVQGRYLRANMPLLSVMVPDANGIQILTSAHLERANDLSGWEIRDLGGDRYLVRANDLEPWYADTQQDPDALRQARKDFGDMILTYELIAADPMGTVTWRT